MRPDFTYILYFNYITGWCWTTPLMRLNYDNPKETATKAGYVWVQLRQLSNKKKASKQERKQS